MAQTFNPAVLEFCKQASEFSIKLIKEWLANYKFKNWDKDIKTKEKRAEEIAKKLDESEEWKLHGYPLNKKELENMRLQIEYIPKKLLVFFKKLDLTVKEMMKLYNTPYLIKFKEGEREKKNR